MSFGLLVLIMMLLMLAGVVPSWPHRRGHGWGPTGGPGLALLVVVGSMFTGVV